MRQSSKLGAFGHASFPILKKSNKKLTITFSKRHFFLVKKKKNHHA